jgi:hypothetical protein
MKPIPDADENRRLLDIETEKASRLPTGSKKDAHLKKARDHDSAAHSADWRNSNLYRPD